MSRVSFSPEYGSGADAEKFDRLKLTKNERRRILCIESPWMEWRHDLKAPKIVDGQALWVTRTRRDKTEYQAFDTDFVGAPICLGDPVVLQDKGVDAQNCPACAAALRSDAVPQPVRRYAMNIIEYAIRQDANFTVTEPFGARILVWTFTARQFDKLLGFQREWQDLKAHDLKLGPCEDQTFQRYEIAISQEAAWMANEQRRAYISALWNGPGNRATDDQLRDACGRKTTLEWLRRDVELVEARTAQAHRAGAAAPAGAFAQQVGQAGLAAGFGDILNAPAAAPAAAAAPHPLQAAAAAQSDPFAGVAPMQASVQAPAAPAVPAAAPAGFDPFAAPAPAQPPAAASATPFQAGTAGSAAPQPQMAPQATGNGFDPFAAVSPQAPAAQPAAPAPGGLAEFDPATTLNPDPVAQPQGAAPAAETAPVSFDDIMRMGQTQGPAQG